MKNISGNLLLMIALLTALAVAASPATATITPAGGTINASSVDSLFAVGGVTVRCTTSTFVGRISADGLSASGELHFFGPATRTTCISQFGTSCDVVTGSGRPTTITLRSTASTAGSSAVGDIVLDADFTENINCPTMRVTCTISGSQTLRGGVVFHQGPPSRFHFDSADVICGPERIRLRLGGRYTIRQRVTIS